jgi:protein SCO1/2
MGTDESGAGIWRGNLARRHQFWHRSLAMHLGIFVSGVALLALTASCEKTSSDSNPATPPAPATAANTSTQIFQVKGTVIELKPEEKAVRIKHEKIPDYMEAMTMSFDVRDTNELAGLEAGDTVAFRMTVTDTDGWIDQIKRLNASRTNTLPTTGSFRFVRDVDPLNIGDPLPEYHFTNHLGQPVSLSQFRRQALAITFIFTRCPFPTFCPLMANNFEQVQKQLLTTPNAPTNWHLLTISFDPEWDTPPRLKAFAERYHCDPPYWSFLTGTLIDITAITEQFGQQFWREGQDQSISHNLRTVVVDARSRVQAILRENKWKPEELTAEILKAAAVKE